MEFKIIIGEMLREKASIEKREQKLKKFAQRVPATKKFFYKFGGTDNNEEEKKEKLKYIDEIKRLSVENRDAKEKPNYLNPRKSSREIIKDPQLLEIEMQLKNIQSQKRKVNQLIYRELRDTKSSWRDLSSKTSLFDVRNLMDRSEDEHIKNLCRAMEKTTQQVANLHRSYTDFDNLKNGVADELKKDDKNNDQFNFSYGRGDSNEISHSKKGDEMFQTDFSADKVTNYSEWYSNDQVPRPANTKPDYGLRRNSFSYPHNDDSFGNPFSHCDTATEMLRNLKVSENEGVNDPVSPKFQNVSIPYRRNEDSSQNSETENSKVVEHSINQSNPVMPIRLANKYPLLNSQMMQSEYLRKLCFKK
ncbi:hypothetical protein QAD02_016152 [Eretmocerus hayati]|uniref:Uncharacterized protein n=1 Tax=Eretmocerus hayati TaxID=131215 RepID=A0ACC2P9U1_9HYME|nr:hypothetical protein QAD02_016152 [Eretmocerus hayati]